MKRNDIYVLNEDLLSDVEQDEVEDNDESSVSSYEDSPGKEYGVKITYFGKRYNGSDQDFHKLCERTSYNVFYNLQTKKKITSFWWTQGKGTLVMQVYQYQFKTVEPLSPDFVIVLAMSLIKNISCYVESVEIRFGEQKYTISYVTKPRNFDSANNKVGKQIMLSSMLFFKKLFPNLDNEKIAYLFVRYAIRFGLLQCIETEHMIFVLTVGKKEALFDATGMRISEWYDYIYFFTNGFATVVLKDKGENFIDCSGKLISDVWFDSCRCFDKNGYAIVYNDRGLYNFMDTEGNLVSKKEWFQYVVAGSNEDLFIVKRKDYYTFMDRNGKVNNNGFKSIKPFKNGFAIVGKSDGANYYSQLYNFISTDGKILSPDLWFGYCQDFCGDFAIVKKLNDTVYNLIDKNGKLFSNDWYKSIECYDAPYFIYKLEKDNKTSLVRFDGSYVVDEVFDYVKTLNHRSNDFEYVIVERGGYKNALNVRTGEYKFKEWKFLNILDYQEDEGIWKVMIEPKTNTFVDDNGNQVLENNYDFDTVVSFSKTMFRVSNINDGMVRTYKVIYPNGEPVVDIPLKNAYMHTFDNGYKVIVVTDTENKNNCICPDGKLMFDEWVPFEFEMKEHCILISQDTSLKPVCNILGRNGKPVYDKWFMFLQSMTSMPVVVYAHFETINGVKERRYNILNTNGLLFSPNEWFDDIPTICDDGMIYIDSNISCDYDGNLITCV